MSGIREALEYVVGLRRPSIFEVNGEQYADKELHRIVHNPKAESIRMSTLTSLVDYIKNDIDCLDDNMIVHVVSPTKVHLYSSLDLDRKRESVVIVEHETPEFNFNSFIEHEQFCIAIQSKFISSDDTDKELILRFAGTVEDGTVTDYGDDGVSQKATIKTSLVNKEDAIIPNPVKLRPYRTFVEVEQPASEFIFRMRSDRCGIQCAIFEADGGAWRNAAMKNVSDYLKEELKEFKSFTVLS